MKKLSKEQLQRLKEQGFQNGGIPWNKDKNQFNNKIIKKIADSKRGKHHALQSEFKNGHIPQNKGTGNKIKCDNCSKIFFRPKCHIMKVNFCCRKCFGEWMSNNKSRENHPNWKGGKPKCDICGKKLSSYTRKTNLCSKCCPSIVHSGKKNNNWKGGITPIAEKIRKSIRYKQWRKLVFERDNYTCQLCYEIGGKLNAHHPIKFSKLIKTEFEKYIFDLRNGVTFCKDCHKSL